MPKTFSSPVIIAILVGIASLLVIMILGVNGSESILLLNPDNISKSTITDMTMINDSSDSDSSNGSISSFKPENWHDLNELKK